MRSLIGQTFSPGSSATLTRSMLGQSTSAGSSVDITGEINNAN